MLTATWYTLAVLPAAAIWTYIDGKTIKRIEREVFQWIKGKSGQK